MGLLFSVIISYAGTLEAMECLKHILSGIIPEGDPDFQELVDYYNTLLQKSSNKTSNEDWTKMGGQGYLCLTDNDDGKLKSAAIKYYNELSDSTAVLFSTKISSFGQDSVESVNSNVSNGVCNSDRTERYTTTKTIISDTSESFSIGQRNRSPTPSYQNVSDPTVISESSFVSNDNDEEKTDGKEKLTWHYRPLSPAPTTLPEIHFQSYEETDEKGDHVYNEDFLRLILFISCNCTSHILMSINIVPCSHIHCA